jgi:hypothetical protein
MKCKTRKCGRPLTLLAEKFRGTCNFCSLLATGQATQGTLSEGWPRKSLALAVHPSQIEEFTREARELGTHAEFYPDGHMKVDSAAHQAEYARAYNMRDADYSRRGFA